MEERIPWEFLTNQEKFKKQRSSWRQQINRTNTPQDFISPLITLESYIQKEYINSAFNNKFNNWKETLENSKTLGRISRQFCLLEFSIKWDRLIEKCSICRTSFSCQFMIICDSCEKHVHINCIQHSTNSSLTNKSSWTCEKCTEKSKKKENEADTVQSNFSSESEE